MYLKECTLEEFFLLRDDTKLIVDLLKDGMDPKRYIDESIIRGFPSITRMLISHGADMARVAYLIPQCANSSVIWEYIHMYMELRPDHVATNHSFAKMISQKCSGGNIELLTANRERWHNNANYYYLYHRNVFYILFSGDEGQGNVPESIINLGVSVWCNNPNLYDGDFIKDFVDGLSNRMKSAYL